MSRAIAGVSTCEETFHAESQQVLLSSTIALQRVLSVRTSHFEILEVIAGEYIRRYNEYHRNETGLSLSKEDNSI